MKKALAGLEYLCGGLLLVLSILLLAQVVLRNLIGWGFPWSEEMARYLLLTMVLLMSPVIFFRDEHVGLDLFSSRFSASGMRLYQSLKTLLILSFYIVYVISHIKFMQKSGDIYSPTLNLSNYWFFLSGFVGAIFGIVVGIYKLIGLFRQEKNS